MDSMYYTNALQALRFNGQKLPGNIDLNNRPEVVNPDGDISTERSFSIGTPKGEVLLPTVIGGRLLPQTEAIQHFYKTGEHLGIFDSKETADEYAKKLHERFDKKKKRR